MIYFTNEIIKFPKHFNQTADEIQFINEMTGEINTLEVEDLSVDPRYYEFDFSNLVLKSGTYKYVIGQDLGLMQVGDYIRQTQEYNEIKQNVVYEQ